MARLTDITLYDEFHPAEGQRQFQHRANYVSELYWQCLHGYKPAKTTRICITMVPDQQPPYPLMAGSVACISQVVHTPTYDALPDSSKLRYLLDGLHQAVGHLCQTFRWDGAVFADTYQRVLDRNLTFQFVYPERVSRNGKTRAHLLLEKTLTTSRLFACVQDEGKQVQALLREGPNRWWHDPVYHLVKRGKWFNNAQFGVHTTRPYFRAWYSLLLGTVDTE